MNNKRRAEPATLSEILLCAVKNGHPRAEAEAILIRDGVPPDPKFKVAEYDITDFDEDNLDFNYSDESKNIMRAFFEQENATIITLIHE